MDADTIATDTPLLTRILLNLQQDPDVPALYFQDRCISNRQLLYKSYKLAQLLHATGIGKGDVVGVYFERCPEVLVVLLALWLCEAVYFPIDRSWPLARLQDCCDRAQPRCVITQPGLQGDSGKLGLDLLYIPAMSFGEEIAQHLPLFDSSTLPPAQHDALAYILFTSGSSGSPKGVQISHGNLANFFNAAVPLLQLEPGWRMLGCASLCFDIVFFELLAPLLTGATLVLADQEEYRQPERLLDLIGRQHIDVVQATPALWSLLLQAGLSMEHGIRLALSIGEALPSKVARQLFDCSQALWNLYGPTECTVWASAYRIRTEDLAADLPSLPIGKPLHGYEFELSPLAGNDTPASCGELLISGKSLARGYLNAPEQTAAAFKPDASGALKYHSGDYCSRDPDGTLHFIRRLDDQVKVNGYRIETAEIALRLEAHSSIQHALCLARTRPDGVTQLLAFVVCAPNMPNKDKERWNRHLSAWLPDWMLPDRYFLVENFPLTSSGKVDMQALLQLAEFDEGTIVQAASSLHAGLQLEVSRIFCEILEIPSIGPCDSFFDQGGSSMLSATLVLALNQHFDTNVSLRQALIVPPTVTSMCRLLEQAGARADAPELTKTACPTHGLVAG
jgi:amino acid adenylation domain-containing protein